MLCFVTCVWVAVIRVALKHEMEHFQTSYMQLLASKRENGSL